MFIVETQSYKQALWPFSDKKPTAQPRSNMQAPSVPNSPGGRPDAQIQQELGAARQKCNYYRVGPGASQPDSKSQLAHWESEVQRLNQERIRGQSGQLQQKIPGLSEMKPSGPRPQMNYPVRRPTLTR